MTTIFYENYADVAGPNEQKNAIQWYLRNYGLSIYDNPEIVKNAFGSSKITGQYFIFDMDTVMPLLIRTWIQVVCNTLKAKEGLRVHLPALFPLAGKSVVLFHDFVPLRPMKFVEIVMLYNKIKQNVGYSANNSNKANNNEIVLYEAASTWQNAPSAGIVIEQGPQNHSGIDPKREGGCFTASSMQFSHNNRPFNMGATVGYSHARGGSMEASVNFGFKF